MLRYEQTSAARHAGTPVPAGCVHGGGSTASDRTGTIPLFGMRLVLQNVRYGGGALRPDWFGPANQPAGVSRDGAGALWDGAPVV